MFALGLGLFISTLARNQFVASQLAFLTTMMPAMMLSGMLFDIAAMPHWLQVITYAVPARYLVSILQTLFLAGDVWAVLLPNLAALAVAAARRRAGDGCGDAAEAGLMACRAGHGWRIGACPAARFRRNPWAGRDVFRCSAASSH